ncbi:MAG: tRNA pseudouridine(55) synthase TruB [SAR324 cluster bacterium]|nr:tRNA pseudouridine(55) synthase TruB [SAR324 cluster bacterium]
MRIININKPKDWTSFDVVRFVKRRFKEKKVGHIGTLDPMATGVLPVFLGQATRLIPLFNNLDKSYCAICKFGESTDTYDADGKVLETYDTSVLDPQKIYEAFYSFLGQRKQIIPAFSASKIKGVPAYKLARQGLKVPVKFRPVIFHELEVKSLKIPFLHFRVKCSKGTYIRTLVNDLGLLLKVGAHLSSLKRLACGTMFHINNSVTINDLKKKGDDKNFPWISALKLLNHLYTVSATTHMLTFIKHGRQVEVPMPIETVKYIENYPENELSKESNQILTKVLDSNHNLVAIGHVMCKNDVWLFQPSKVFI